MTATRTYARIDFDEPKVGPLDVTVYGPDGTILRIIPGAVLRERKLSNQRPPESSRRSAKIPSVAPRRRTKTERDY